MVEKTSYVSHSKQAWKVWLFDAMLLAGFLCFLIPLNAQIESADVAAGIVFGGLALGLTGFIWLSLSIRCKKCNANLGWEALRGKHFNYGFLWLFTTEACPVCGDDGRTASNRDD